MRANAKSYAEEQKGRPGGGGGNLPKFLTEEGLDERGRVIVTTLTLAHVRGKGKGTWGVSALLMAVTGPQAGAVHKHDMWTAQQVAQFIVGGYGFVGNAKGDPSYENGLPEDPCDDQFEAEGRLLDEMIQIITCGDQTQTKDGKKVWLPTIPPEKRRSPYFELVAQPDSYNPKYLNSKYTNPIRERGTDGPYFIGDYRKVLTDPAAIKTAKDWFFARCEKMVREANDAAEKRRSSGGGYDGGGGGPEYVPDDDIPF